MQRLMNIALENKAEEIAEALDEATAQILVELVEDGPLPSSEIQAGLDELLKKELIVAIASKGKECYAATPKGGNTYRAYLLEQDDTLEKDISLDSLIYKRVKARKEAAATPATTEPTTSAE